MNEGHPSPPSTTALDEDPGRFGPRHSRMRSDSLTKWIWPNPESAPRAALLILVPLDLVGPTCSRPALK